MKRKPIYVETSIDGTISDVWKYTQEPELHERWDLRFSSITYLPKEDGIQPFLYKTNIGFGMSIEGEGRSRGSKQLQDGSRLSTLEFGTDQSISLIKKGSGFWKYEEKEKGIRFYTKYDYDTRFGFAGALFDRVIFRPLIGWATAWSFDSLKLWIEKGTPPEQSIRRLITNMLICFVLAFIWIYQGLIPKVLFPHTGEIQLLQEAGVFTGVEHYAVRVIGILEIIVGLLFLLPIKKRLLFILSSLFVLLLGLGALFTNLDIYLLPFNPATLNIAMVVLGVVGIINEVDLPIARNCIRRAQK
ncbi:DoxX-like family protein [Evansella sp. AB-rgal1]|uniref:DoxX-like family protein n=1 Tax=Evansella sp. AB-rgal1 TaxID=3242696 RepID=UPI00359DD80E